MNPKEQQAHVTKQNLGVQWIIQFIDAMCDAEPMPHSTLPVTRYVSLTSAVGRNHSRTFATTSTVSSMRMIR